ncbi:MAG TPA: diguanylate cyclase [Stellaceae bacterium]|jgi:diguanylate cyclase|nr:diguanylate cyclase [Stellaceae bacterium]
MATHAVTPTPHNYTVWYSYIAGTMPTLRQAIDALLAKQTTFTDGINADLYKRYFGGAEDHVDVIETGGRLQAVIDQVSRYLDDHTGEIGSFGNTLDNISTAMGRSQSQERVRALVADLVRETQSMAQRNQNLESRLGRIANEVTELRENLQIVTREALTDALTGIPNRKFFDTRLQEAAREALSEGEAMSLVLCDIDHFKRFNDSFGHQVGDQVLRLVARTLSDSVKGRDTPARFGGEEFAIILPRTNLQQGAIVADQIRNGVMRRRFVGKDTRDDYGGVTLSFGVAQYRANEDLADLVGRADAALYHAKHEGRNRVSTEINAGDLARAS